jgi:predicted amidophosphoribosyltransferase
MKVNVKKIKGNWDDGYALDKHVIKSTFLGYNDRGRAEFDTLRTEAGESLFQLKYRNDWKQAPLLAEAVFEHIVPNFPAIGLIVPVPASKIRARQPVHEVAKELAKLMKLGVFDNILVKAASKSGKSLKDLGTKAEKVAELSGRLSINDGISGKGTWNALLLDDLFDTGASMEAATAALRAYDKIAGIYVAALSWK